MWKYVRENPGKVALGCLGVAATAAVLFFTLPVSGPLLIVLGGVGIVFCAAGGVAVGVALGLRSGQGMQLRAQAIAEEREGLTADAAEKDKALAEGVQASADALARLAAVEALAAATKGRVDEVEVSLAATNRQQASHQLAVERRLAARGGLSGAAGVGLFAVPASAPAATGELPGLRRRAVGATV